MHTPHFWWGRSVDIEPLSYLKRRPQDGRVGGSFIIHELRGGGRRGRGPFISAILNPGIAAERENDPGVNGTGDEALHDNGTTERVSSPPAGYLYRADYAIELQPFIPDRDAARPALAGGGAHSRVPGQFLSLHHPLHYQSGLGFHCGQRETVLGETAGLPTHLAHTGTHDCLFKPNNKGSRAPQARPGRAQGWVGADRKELINPALMTPLPPASEVSSQRRSLRNTEGAEWG